MFAEARVNIGQVDRPVVPEDAVDQRGKQMHVFVAKAGEVQDRIVAVASAGQPGMVAISKGIEPGEVVVRGAKGNPKIIDGLNIEGGAAAQQPGEKPADKPAEKPAAPAAPAGK
jgi:hypothetical protein